MAEVKKKMYRRKKKQLSMTARDLRKLSRAELIELLLDQRKETEVEPEQPEGELEPLKDEWNRIQYRKRYYRILRSTIGTLITVAAVAVLVATLWMPVLKIYGSSMAPTLADGEIILSRKTSDFALGDIVSFYYNNKILVKRVIGQAASKNKFILKLLPASSIIFFRQSTHLF